MKLFLTIGSLALLAFGMAPSARADEWNKKTIMTVNETIQVPNKVLPPGTYVFKLLNSPSDRHIVQIFNADETELQTTILAIPNYRLEPTGDTVFAFWEMPPGQPPALRAWFYPGDNFGQEFAYPKTKAVAIAAVAHTEVPSTEVKEPAEMPTAPVTEVIEETPVEEAAAPPAPEPAPIVEAAPTPVAPLPELPKTASPYPLIGVAGMLSLAIFALMRAIRIS